MITKRVKYVLTSVLLALGFVGVGFLPDNLRLFGICGLSLATLVMFVWFLWEGLGINATLFTLVLPVFFTVGVGLFWFLLPSTLLTRLPVIGVYGVGMYVLCSTMNIFTVSVIRNIALVRAARGVGFVLTLFVFFLLFDAILSLRVMALFNGLLVFAISYPLFLQGLWMSKLTREFSRELFYYSLIMSWSVATLAIGIYFWPVSVVVGSLFLTVGVYELLGLGQVELEGRLFKRTVRDYVVVGILVFISVLLVTSWRG